MQEKTDRRILRTRHQLRDVLLDLAMQMPLESITVKILTEHAGLNRGTFYLHYQDIHDFHEQLKNDILEEFHAIIKKISHPIGSHQSIMDPPSGYVRPFEYVLEQKRFFQVFMGSTGDNVFSLQLTELLKKQFLHAYLLQHKQFKPSDVPDKQYYLFAYLASAYVGTMQFWIQQDFQLLPTEMAILFSQISRLGSAHVRF